MAAYPLDHQLSPSPTIFAYLLADVWWSLYPNGEVPRYQVLQTSLGGAVLEYHAKVFMAVNLPIGMHTYNFPGWTCLYPRSCFQLSALAGLTGILHQESVMQQNRAFRFYPTLATIPQQVRFPRPLAKAEAAVISTSG